MEEVIYFVAETQEPEAQNLFRYHDELDAIVAYYNAVAANYSAYKSGAVNHFAVYLLNKDFSILNMERK